jgi:hypothetical protein
VSVGVAGFLRDGYVAIRGAVDPGVAARCRAAIWESLAARGIREEDQATWPAAVQAGDFSSGPRAAARHGTATTGDPFAAAGRAPALVAACDELIGTGLWASPLQPGAAIVARFPSQDRANAGYHIEGSYPGPGGHWVNIRSRARGLLALFLLSDVGPDDAPTRLVCGSHLYVPEFLAPYGDEGTLADAEFWRPSVLCRPVAHATGRAGDVFLCHPFLVHTATWPHRGSVPRMIAQPAVHVRDGFTLDGSDPSPTARAIVTGLAMARSPG